MSKKLPPEEQELWENFTKTIKPIKRDKVAPESPKKIFFTEKPFLPVPSIKRTQKVEALHANDLKTLSLDGKFDLHGFSQAYGEIALKEFLKTAFYKGWRWVCIITGKGSIDNPSVLREQTPKWLKAMPEFVTGYSQAKPEDGGNGALYVKIRRKTR
jgi:DNA-nicking Smr family endonuclease